MVFWEYKNWHSFTSREIPKWCSTSYDSVYMCISIFMNAYVKIAAFRSCMVLHQTIREPPILPRNSTSVLLIANKLVYCLTGYELWTLW